MAETSTIDRMKLMDLCAKRKSPAANIVMAALTRWRGEQSDVERAVVIVYREEAEKLRRRLLLLKRVGILIPLFGLLCGLLIVNKVMSEATLENPAAAQDFAPALRPLIVGVIASIIAAFFHGAFTSKVDRLARMLDRLGDQAVDAVVLASARAPEGEDSAKVAPRNAKGLRIEIPEELANAEGTASVPSSAPPTTAPARAGRR